MLYCHMCITLVCIVVWDSLLQCIVMIIFFFFKQKTAYEMRISDWSSDVCSSDLPVATHATLRRQRVQITSGFACCTQCGIQVARVRCDEVGIHHAMQIGRASCRERVCQYV